jgi:hypothetical protein
LPKSSASGHIILQALEALITSKKKIINIIIYPFDLCIKDMDLWKENLPKVAAVRTDCNNTFDCLVCPNR